MAIVVVIIIIIPAAPTAVPPLLLTIPAYCVRGERIYVDRCLEEVCRGGGEMPGPLIATYLRAGARVGRLGEQTLHGEGGKMKCRSFC